MQPSRAERRRLLSRCNRRAGCLALLIGFIFQALVFARVILSKRSIADDPVLHDVQSEAAIARLRRDWHAGGRRAYAGNDDGSGPEGLPDGGSTLLLNSEQRSSTGDTQHGTAASSDAAASIDDSLWEDADFSSAQPPPSRAAAATGLARRGDRGSRGPNGLIADLTDKKAEDNSDGSGAGGDAAQPAPSAGTNAPATAQQVAFDPGSDDVTVPSEPYNASDPQGIGAFMRKYVVPPDEPLKCAASQKAERRLAVSLAPVRVAVMTSHFFGDYEREVECSYGGCPLKCTFEGQQSASKADILWYHAPAMCGNEPARFHPQQLRAIMSMEPTAYYSCLGDRSYMDKYELEMTYRMCSAVPVHFLYYTKDSLVPELYQPVIPTAKKEPHIVYINGNCHPPSGRGEIIDALIKMNGTIKVHSYGGCNRNMHVNGRPDKMQIFRRYKFCIAIENSVGPDYVTEKLYQAFTTGCVPIYLGAPNIADFWVHPDSIIDYKALGGTPEALYKEILRLNSDDEAYERKLAWKKLPITQLAPPFLRMLAGALDQHTQCKLCRTVVEQRIDPVRNFKNSHCLRNASWLAKFENDYPGGKSRA